MFCGEWSVVKRFNPGLTVTPLYCRSWSCETCQPSRQRQLIAQAMAGRPDTFLTITVNPAVGESPNDRARMLADAWRKIVRLARQEAARDLSKRPLPYGKPPADGWKADRSGRVTRKVTLPDGKLAFLAVVEAQKSGEPHLHILARAGWIDQRWLSAQMASLMGAPVCDVRRINSVKQAASYVVKYCGKEPHRFGSTKRYWCTQDYERWRSYHRANKRGDPLDVYVVRKHWLNFITRAVGIGLTVEYEDEGAFLAWKGSTGGLDPPAPPLEEAARARLNL